MKYLGAFFKSFLVAVSFHSVKALVDQSPASLRRPIVLALRGSVYLCVLLTFFSFLCGRAVALGNYLQLSSLLLNILIGIFFVISCIGSFFLTAMVEGVYKTASAFAEQTVGVVKKTSAGISKTKENLTQTLDKTRKAVMETGDHILKTGETVYDVSRKVASNGFVRTSEVGHQASEKGKEIFDQVRPKAEEVMGKIKPEVERAFEKGGEIAKDASRKIAKIRKKESPETSSDFTPSDPPSSHS